MQRTRKIRLLCLAVAACAIGMAEKPANAQTLFALSHPALLEAPCGPDWLPWPFRLLIPQGAFGASFRSACLAHDACYETAGPTRLQCDRRFLNTMLRRCNSSWWPCGCRFVARFMYGNVRQFGEGGYQRGQKIAQRRCASGSRARCRICRWRR